ncbi:MAG TPA: hypothetical protein VLT88_14990, partial [Desulfosarcina sp.]|nr:hypothetical protein [Desulfosarcina sp.]
MSFSASFDMVHHAAPALVLIVKRIVDHGGKAAKSTSAVPGTHMPAKTDPMDRISIVLVEPQGPINV